MAKFNITINENKKNLKESNREYNKFISLGIKDIQKNNLGGAVKNFLNAVNLNSKKFEAFINLSNVYILQNKIKKSVEVLKNYLVVNNYQLNIVNHLGIICIKYNYENDLIKLFKYLDLDINSDNNKKNYFLYYLRGKFLQKKK